MADTFEGAPGSPKLKRKRVDDSDDELKNERRDALRAAFGGRSPRSTARNKKAPETDHKDTRDMYLDTMAEESEDEEGQAFSDKEEEEDEGELGAEIPEEMKGFIVDKVDEDEVRDESDVSDVEYDPDVLDDDDLALIAENTGQTYTKDEDDDQDRKHLRRLKKGTAAARHQEELDNWLEDEDIDRGNLDLSDAWTAVYECFGDVDLVVQILKNERVVQSQEEAAISDYEADVPELPAPTEVTLETLADPDELAKEYMTKGDEEIREKDEPERLYIRYKNRPRQTDYEELTMEAQWISRRLMSDFPEDLSIERIRDMYDMAFRGTFPFPNGAPEDDISDKCGMVLSWLLNERWEVPFILHHKRHLICPPLTDDMVWAIYHLDAEWVKLKYIAERIMETIEVIGRDQLPNDLLYYAVNFSTIEDLQDVNAHLRYHHRKAFYVETVQEEQEVPKLPAPPAEPVEALENLQDAETEDDEDDVFGEFAFGNTELETVEEPRHFKSPASEFMTSPLSDPIPGEPAEADIKDYNKSTHVAPEEHQNGFSEIAFSMGATDAGESEEIETQNADDGYQPDNANGAIVPVDTVNDSLYHGNNENEDAEDMEVDGDQDTDHAPAKANALLDMDESELKDEYNDEEDVGDRQLKDLSQSIMLLDMKATDGSRDTKKRNADMFVIDSIEKGGFHEYWRGCVAEAKHFATVLEKSLTPGAEELTVQMDQVRLHWKELGATRVMDVPSIIEGSEEQQVEDICAQYCAPPFNSGKRLYTALVNYHTKLLANNITIRRILREYYRKYCCITCTTTTKGESEVDIADSTWVTRRLFRLPLQDLLIYGQVSYSYPKDQRTREDRKRILEDRLKETMMPELYLQILKLEKEGTIKCTVHPVCAKEVPPWKEDDFSDRFSEWYERYKVVTYSGSQVVNENYRNRMVEQKSILEKEEMALKDSDERDRHWRRNILDQLAMAYCPSNIPTYSIWKYIQKDILQRLLNVELIPKFRMEVREELWRRAQACVLLHSQRMLQYKLDILPSPNETVLAMAAEESTQRVYAAVVNETGDLKEYKRLDSLVESVIPLRNVISNHPLMKDIQQEIEVLENLIKQFRINVVLVAMCNLGAVTLCDRLERYLLPKMSNGLVLKKLGVEVPRLRMSMMKNGSVTDLCVSMARWYIDPLSETLNLWNPNDTNLLLKLNLHPLQNMISQEKLQEYLEATLVHVVCDCGVDINRIKNSKHLESTLQFVAGLGPRKAMDVVRLLKIASIGTRTHLRMGHGTINGLGDQVYYNCASFIKISSADAMDVLDTTRLHPIECYATAEKLCTDSLEEDLSGEEAIQEIFNAPNKLDYLDLEAYSSILLEKRNQPRMLPYLLFVRSELKSPFKDSRAELQDMTDNEEFCQVLQIDQDLLRRGAHVICRINDVTDNSLRACILPLELRAHVTDYRNFRDDVNRMAKEQNRKIQLRGTCISARIATVEYKPSFETGKAAYRVEVTITGQQRRYLLLELFNDIKRTMKLSEERLSPLVHFDVNYSKKPMLNEYTEKHKIHYRRVIRHPSYRMWPLSKIVAFLKQPEIPIGECCICPMSEWDRLNLVIKTCEDPFNCATFVIHERNQRVPGELGKELILLNQTYNSIDQIIAQFCETLKLNLEEIYVHPKLKRSTDLSKAERDLIQESAMRPDGIAWAILPPTPPSHKASKTSYNPLRFTLLVIPPGLEMSQGTRSLQDSIYVDHKSFKLWTHKEKSLSALIKWWKQVGYWNRNRHREMYNQEKLAMMNQQGSSRKP